MFKVNQIINMENTINKLFDFADFDRLINSTE